MNNLPVWQVNRLSLGFYAGRGVTIPITEKVIFDLGFNFNWNFGRKRFRTDYDPFVDKYSIDYQEYFEKPIGSVMLGNIQSSYLFEFYFKIGLVK